METEATVAGEVAVARKVAGTVVDKLAGKVARAGAIFEVDLCRSSNSLPPAPHRYDLLVEHSSSRSPPDIVT